MRMLRAVAGVAVAVAGVLALGSAPAGADHIAQVLGPADGVYDTCVLGEIANPVQVRLETSRVHVRTRRDGSVAGFTCRFDVPAFVAAEDRLFSDQDWVLPDRAVRYRTLCGSPDQVFEDGRLVITPSGRGVLSCRFPR